MCHEYSYLDFLQFNSALILGKVENNDLYSNGVGKTTIFKAIEYSLFNQADVNLDKIIRDDAQSCKITIDFISEDQEYRLVRTRTKKGSTDISLLQKLNVEEDENIPLHIKHEQYSDIFIPVINEKLWKDISGRRAADTEKDLNKILKINFKSFRSTVHFMQNDFSGLTTSTPEKRKGILKEALNLAVYSKLEKIAKDKSNLISKDIEKHQTLIESLKDPEKDIENLNSQLSNIDLNISESAVKLSKLTTGLDEHTLHLSKLNIEAASLESKFADFVINQKKLNKEKLTIEASIKDYSSKKNATIKIANEIIAELKSLKENKTALSDIDYSQIEILQEQISSTKDIISKNSAYIQSNILKVEELKIPLPLDADCKHCRQSLSKEHRMECQQQIDIELKNAQQAILDLKKQNKELNNIILNNQNNISQLINSKKELEKIIDTISFKEKEISDKKIMHKEYADLVSKLQEDLENIEDQIKESNTQSHDFHQEEFNKIKSLIDKKTEEILEINKSIALVNKEITHVNAARAVLIHNIEQKQNDKNKKELLEKNLLELTDKYSIYPFVLQAFSSTGIPNLIIQNVLDDLQIEANNLLSQLKPSLQLSFAIEKTKSDGSESDTLDINYLISGKERQYDQLSGAQKLAVTFSLKLGLSFLLQKMIGTNIQFLMLDEIDQALDKASVDAFADIVKHFQKDFTILVITHNDRLKDKFKHTILVEQDINMVSRARVLNSY
jgi:DNA repair exonuclease SbcCD ATPase subunit